MRNELDASVAYRTILNNNVEATCIEDFSGITLFSNSAYLNMLNKQKEKTDSSLLSLKAGKVKPLLCSSCAFGVYDAALPIMVMSEGGAIFMVKTFSPKKRDAIKCIQHIYKLTKQECAVLAAMENGSSVKAISRQIKISAHTICGHMKSLYLKMSVTSRAQAQFKLSTINLDQDFKLCSVQCSEGSADYVATIESTSNK